MIQKIPCGFFSFLRLIVCFCLFILIAAGPFSEAYDENDNHSEETNRLEEVNFNGLFLNYGAMPESEISHIMKKLDYKAKTHISDFGDYKIEANTTDSDIVVIAIHGGKIEQGTTELAYALSSHNDYSYFSYLGVKSYDNSNLHISSDEFDEPTALEMVSNSEKTLSIHGCAGSEEFTYVGGRDTELADKIMRSLTEHGFTVLDTPRDLAGISPNNIVNKNKRGSGVQIELSQGLRIQFLSGNGNQMEDYVRAISEAVETP